MSKQTQTAIATQLSNKQELSNYSKDLNQKAAAAAFLSKYFTKPAHCGAAGIFLYYAGTNTREKVLITESGDIVGPKLAKEIRKNGKDNENRTFTYKDVVYKELSITKSDVSKVNKDFLAHVKRNERVLRAMKKRPHKPEELGKRHNNVLIPTAPLIKFLSSAWEAAENFFIKNEGFNTNVTPDSNVNAVITEFKNLFTTCSEYIELLASDELPYVTRNIINVVISLYSVRLNRVMQHTEIKKKKKGEEEVKKPKRTAFFYVVAKNSPLYNFFEDEEVKRVFKEIQQEQKREKKNVTNYEPSPPEEGNFQYRLLEIKDDGDIKITVQTAANLKHFSVIKAFTLNQGIARAATNKTNDDGVEAKVLLAEEEEQWGFMERMTGSFNALKHRLEELKKLITWRYNLDKRACDTNGSKKFDKWGWHKDDPNWVESEHVGKEADRSRLIKRAPKKKDSPTRQAQEREEDREDFRDKLIKQAKAKDDELTNAEDLMLPLGSTKKHETEREHITKVNYSNLPRGRASRRSSVSEREFSNLSAREKADKLENMTEDQRTNLYKTLKDEDEYDALYEEIAGAVGVPEAEKLFPLTYDELLE